MEKQIEEAFQFLKDNPKVAALALGALFGVGAVYYGYVSVSKKKYYV